ncbi:PIN domain-containing protein [Ferruginivarius sediminum]|uniref:Type II toxin-antitoxin system VapC family toxin n=1 Tax=Ferruginivarius sediminum TaxID=2661937 RepID=A0A369T6U0_9PROT|nr:PIN domain-containing protein [Ferruginivarius sediminum]RDD60602.1 type II toxin-antitoxin system VapC family toxin [Ferruginivarius sediminum]
MYLIDTNILSQISPTKPGLPDLTQWISDHAKDIFISVVTIAEVKAGIRNLEVKGATRRARMLKDWLSEVLLVYADRILGVDLQTACLTGEFMAIARLAQMAEKKRAAAGDVLPLNKKEKQRVIKTGFEDACIAATAAINGFTVLTQNVKDFRPMGAKWHDPLVILPVDELPKRKVK